MSSDTVIAGDPRDRGVSVRGSRPLAALPAVPAGDVLLRHGYTLARVNKLATAAVVRDVFHQSLPWSDRLELAWSAIVEHLYAVQEPPNGNELIRTAWYAMQAHAEDEWRTHGVSRSGIIDGQSSMVNYWRYWWPQTRNTPGPERRVVERTALAQIWGRLLPSHRRLLAALAAHDDYGLAAASLGKSRATFTTQLSQARREFFALWHEGEKPAGMWGMDRRRSGRSPRKRLMTAALHRRKRDAEKAARDRGGGGE